ncbi:MAG: hypothetical protein ABL890_02750 [Candidatus Peribacteraceae bacterium]
MSPAASASDTTANPLLAIHEHEQTEMKRVEEAKRSIDQEEMKTIGAMEKEYATEEADYKEKKQNELKVFAQKEPSEILQKGKGETDSALKSIDESFAKKKNALVQNLTQDFLSSRTA